MSFEANMPPVTATSAIILTVVVVVVVVVVAVVAAAASAAATFCINYLHIYSFFKSILSSYILFKYTSLIVAFISQLMDSQCNRSRRNGI